MGITGPAINERVVDVREINPRIRHKLIFQLFEHLGETDSLQLIADHDPLPLRLQLESKHGANCQWIYLEEGPNVWRVRLRHHGRRRIGRCRSC